MTLAKVWEVTPSALLGGLAGLYIFIESEKPTPGG